MDFEEKSRNEPKKNVNLDLVVVVNNDENKLAIIDENYDEMQSCENQLIKRSECIQITYMLFDSITLDFLHI